MSEINPQSWFKELDKLFDNVETSTNKVLKEVSNALNYLDPEAPTITQKRKQTFNPKAPTTSLNNSKQEELANHSPNDSTQKNEMQSVYDKAFEKFKINYFPSRRLTKVLNDPEENKNTITDEKQLKLEFNKRIQHLIKHNSRHYIDNELTKLNDKDLRVSFLAAFPREHLQNPKQFDLISKDPNSTHALPASEKQKPTLPSENLSAFQKLKIDQQNVTRKNLQDKKAPEAECPDIFSFFGQHLKTATNFLTSATSFFDSCISPRKTPNSKSNQDSVQQKTATVPTKNQRPGTEPEPRHITKIVPFCTTEESKTPIIPYY